ncbi:MAG: SDR family NAD(P)-dependent oxidoreductase, partial [Spirochaetales bacterium]|nr:SDR family NAD(P)-dependent oxidoreductase [Spirochaetales bacterium]
MDLGISGKTAFVLGGSSGLGFGVASELSKNGVKVAICGRNKEKLENAAKKIGAVPIVGDLTISSEIPKMIKEVNKILGSIDILVTNTGGPPKADFNDADESLWKESFQNIFLSVTNTVERVLPSMKDKGWGRIIMIASMTAKEPLPGVILSNSIRAGLLGLSKSVSTEVAGKGVTVNVILPGYIETQRLRDLGLDLDGLGSTIPAGRVGQPG